MLPCPPCVSTSCLMVVNNLLYGLSLFLYYYQLICSGNDDDLYFMCSSQLDSGNDTTSPLDPLLPTMSPVLPVLLYQLTGCVVMIPRILLIPSSANNVPRPSCISTSWLMLENAYNLLYGSSLLLCYYQLICSGYDDDLYFICSSQQNSGGNDTTSPLDPPPLPTMFPVLPVFLPADWWWWMPIISSMDHLYCSVTTSLFVVVMMTIFTSYVPASKIAVVMTPHILLIPLLCQQCPPSFLCYYQLTGWVVMMPRLQPNLQRHPYTHAHNSHPCSSSHLPPLSQPTHVSSILPHRQCTSRSVDQHQRISDLQKFFGGI
jgi:hypothetical protein